MKLTYLVLTAAMLGTFDCSAQSTNGTGGNAFSAGSYLGYNTTNLLNPLFIKTNGVTRMQLNGISAGYGVNTSGFIGIGTTVPASPLHIVGAQLQNPQDWTRGLTLSNSAALVWDGSTGAAFFMAHPSSTPNGNWYAGSQANLNSNAAVDYALTVHVNSALSTNPLRSTQIFKNLLVYEADFGRRVGVNITSPQAATDVYSNTNQFRLSYGIGVSTAAAALSYTDFFSNSNGRLQIMPSGGRVGINLSSDPTATLDVNGNARIRNVQAAVPNSILVGVNASGSSDINVRRLDFNGAANQYLGGDGQFHSVSSVSTPPSANNGVSKSLTVGGPYQLGDLYTFAVINTNTPLTANGQVRLNGKNLIFSGDGMVGIGQTFPDLPSEKLDVKGNARFREVPEQGGQSILLGLQNGNSVNDLELSRLMFPNSSTVFLAGDGTWQPVTTGFGFSCAQTTDALLPENRQIDLNDHNFYFTRDVSGTLNNNVGFGWPCGTILKAKVDAVQSGLQGIAGSFLTYSATGAIGARGLSNSTSQDPADMIIGVLGSTTGNDEPLKIGIYGNSTGTPNSYAGYFNGDVIMTGLLNPSDIQFKRNIEPMSGALARLIHTKPVTYNFDQTAYPQFDFSERMQYGFIAQDLMTQFPEIVQDARAPGSVNEHGDIEKNGISFKSVNYIALIPINTQAIIELNQKVDRATLSDQSIKTNVQPLTGALDKVLAMDGVSYDWNHNVHPELHLDSVNHLGFIAQQIQSVDSRLTYIGDDSLLHVEYDKIVPVLAEAIQELHDEITNGSVNDSLETLIQTLQAENASQQQEIDNLNDRLTQLENCLGALLPLLCQINQQAIQANTPEQQQAIRTQLEVKLTNKQAIVLDQNVPNPFAEQTVINFTVPPSVQKAQIHFYNAEGRIMQSVDITERGPGSITVFGAELSAGIYTYSLVADGQIIATKRMVKE